MRHPLPAIALLAGPVLAATLADFAKIQVGMTRGAVEARPEFNPDGGLTMLVQGRYCLASCPYLKIDVTYEVARGPDGRVVRSDEDKVTKVSKPYLETPYCD